MKFSCDMLLSELLSKVVTPHSVIGDMVGVEVLAIETDSRLVKENSIFVALKGGMVDGHDFIASAIKNGANVVIVDEGYECQHLDVIMIKSPVVFDLLSELLKIFYCPHPQHIYGVTGTNGKTSIAEFTRQILTLIGKKSATIGTLGVVSDVDVTNEIVNSSLTTSDIVSLYKNLAILKKSGIDDVMIEVSSIGLEQKRVNSLDFAAASFSNFSVDHLDYHRSEEEYFRCKMLFFGEYLLPNHKAILNADIAEFATIKSCCEARNHDIIEYGKNARHIKIINIESSALGQKVAVQIFDKPYEFEVTLSGEFQIYNILCALANVIAIHQLDHDEIQQLLSQFSNLTSAQGRMDLVVTLPNQASIFIDFAHTPDALENVLKLTQNIAKKRVFVLFGCGGNRDSSKRAMMGEIASNLADFVIVSDDNPRNEDPSQIRAQIISGIKGDNFIQIAPRDLAIKESINMLESDDILILAGKGHEKYQIIKDQKYDFDEVKIVKDAAAKFFKS